MARRVSAGTKESVHQRRRRCGGILFRARDSRCIAQREGRAHRCTKSRANKSLWHDHRAQTQLCNAATSSNLIYVTVARYCRLWHVDQLYSLGCRPRFIHLTYSRHPAESIRLDKFARASRSPRYNRGNLQDRRSMDAFADNYSLSFTSRRPHRQLLSLGRKGEGRKRATEGAK